MRNFSLVVVIPTLNEEEAIGYVIDRIKEVLKKYNYHILVVDGGSTDNTVQIAKNKGAIVIRQKDKGYGDAYITGFKYAIKHLNPDILVMIDGDGTYDPLELLKLLQPIIQEDVDMVIGNRFQGMRKEAMTTINKIGNKILSWLARIMIGINTQDTQSGYRVLKKEIIQTVPLREKGMPFATELIVQAYIYGFDIAEVPITYRPRIGGKSKLNPLKDGYRILITIVKFALRYNPTFFIFSLGALMLVPGLVLGAYVAYHYFFTGIKYHVKGLISIMLTLSGFNSLLLAILSIYLKRFELRIIRYLRSMRRT